MALWHLNSARFKIRTIKLILILYHISCYFHVKNGENVYICHVKMIMKRQKLEKDVKITGHSIVYTNTIILVQHLDNQGSIKFFISELILQWHFELTGHLSIKMVYQDSHIRMKHFLLYCAQNDQENWAGKSEKNLFNEWILFFRSSFFAGLAGAIFSTPVDVIKVCDYTYVSKSSKVDKSLTTIYTNKVFWESLSNWPFNVKKYSELHYTNKVFWESLSNWPFNVLSILNFRLDQN